MAHGGEQIGDVMVMEPVKDAATITAVADEPQRAQQPEVMRRRAVAELRDGGELVDAALSGDELGEHPQPAGRAQRAERLRELIGLVYIEAARRRAVLRGVRHRGNTTHVSTSSCVRRGAALAAIAALTAPEVASAHALFADHDPNRPVAEYAWIGFWHMVGGWDHVLFALGVVLVARTPRSAAKLISLFVAGHSLTLLVATLVGWQLDAAVVDVVIALSLVYIGVLGLRGRPEQLTGVGVAVFAFGLAHGLGLATRLQDLGLPDSGVLIRVLVFNIGVELGQLAALGLIIGIGTLIVRRARLGVRDARLAYVMLVASGLLAALTLSLQAQFGASG
jgi:hydrogenase/urease accessory protein HupE